MVKSEGVFLWGRSMILQHSVHRLRIVEEGGECAIGAGPYISMTADCHGGYNSRLDHTLRLEYSTAVHTACSPWRLHGGNIKDLWSRKAKHPTCRNGIDSWQRRPPLRTVEQDEYGFHVTRRELEQKGDRGGKRGNPEKMFWWWCGR